MKAIKFLSAVAVIGLLAVPANADYTGPEPNTPATGQGVGSSLETDFIGILDGIYGGSFTGDAFGGLGYSNGTITVTRVQDRTLGGGNTSAGDNLHLVHGSTSLPETDQVWWDGDATFTARAVFAAYSQRFGIDTDLDGVWETQIMDVTGSGINPTFDLLVDSPLSLSDPWAWMRWGGYYGNTQSSRAEDNADDFDHMLTYKVEGLDPNHTIWLLFFEDLNGLIGEEDPGPDSMIVDRDFNDLVIEIQAIPAPGAALLGMMGLGLVGWIKRRFA